MTEIYQIVTEHASLLVVVLSLWLVRSKIIF